MESDYGSSDPTQIRTQILTCMKVLTHNFILIHTLIHIQTRWHMRMG